MATSYSGSGGDFLCPPYIPPETPPHSAPWQPPASPVLRWPEIPNSPITWEPAAAGPGCAELGIISPKVLVSSEALEVQPLPQAPPLFPTIAESQLLLVSSSVRTSHLGWLAALPPPVPLSPSPCSLLFAKGLNHSHRGPYLSLCS